MPNDPDHGQGRTAHEEAQALGVQKHPHGDVDEWRHRNDEDEERGPVIHAEEPDREGEVFDEPGSRDAGEGTLVKLPVGAKFGMDHEPSPQEREELVRFAAEADAELRGQDDQDAEDETPGT
ncbi:hypothetical protein [Ornithinimicrobium sufpigmenti]|uniref:hypothetical protein n=1 Tax=Ornithinimicrobium sufpigmenti TaxID=2508882 RepID=UPI001035EDC4|nr:MULTISPECIES: hypothetical protein [unclassified Ornithinimicrobium]